MAQWLELMTQDLNFSDTYTSPLARGKVLKGNILVHKQIRIFV